MGSLGREILAGQAGLRHIWVVEVLGQTVQGGHRHKDHWDSSWEACWLRLKHTGHPDSGIPGSSWGRLEDFRRIWRQRVQGIAEAAESRRCRCRRTHRHWEERSPAAAVEADRGRRHHYILGRQFLDTLGRHKDHHEEDRNHLGKVVQLGHGAAETGASQSSGIGL